MANDTNKFQAIISHCKEYGFIFPSSEIYEGLQAVYDYGQMGSELKKNINKKKLEGKSGFSREFLAY